MSVNVIAVPVQRDVITEKIPLVGTLEANEFVDVQSEIDGRIIQVNFEEGQRVPAQELLFQIDQRKLKAALDEAKANLALAQATVDRYKKLIQSNAISQQEYDQALATFEVNKATVILTTEELHDAEIRAPFSGIVGERLVSPGQFVGKGTRLTFIVSDDPIRVAFNVPERYLGRIKVDQKITLTVAAFPEHVFQGTVYFMSPRIDLLTRSALIKARIANKEGQLRPGMFANINLIVDEREALTINENAIFWDRDKASVYVIDSEHKVALRSISLGIYLDGKVEIVSGLQEHESIVSEGHQKLHPGAKVRDAAAEKLGII